MSLCSVESVTRLVEAQPQRYSSPRHLAHRLAPVAGAGGADRIDLRHRDEAGRQAGETIARRRRLCRLQHHQWRVRLGEASIIDGRAKDRRHGGIQLARAAAKAHAHIHRRGQHPDRIALRFLKGVSPTLDVSSEWGLNRIHASAIAD
jgi:hypothetical protein